MRCNRARPLSPFARSRLDALDLNHTPLQVLRVGGSSHRHVRLVHPDDVYGSVALDSDELRGRAEFAHEASSEFFARAVEHARVFNVATRSGTLVDWRMAHSMAYIGSSTVVAGELDFTVSTVRCCHVHVALERREVVKASLLRPERQCFAALVEAKVADFVELDARNALRLAVRLNLPPTAVQTFVTDWVSVTWVLKFVFLCAPDSGGSTAGADGGRAALMWGDDEPMPDESDLQRVEWELDVPLVVTLECRDALRFDESADSIAL